MFNHWLFQPHVHLHWPCRKKTGHCGVWVENSTRCGIGGLVAKYSHPPNLGRLKVWKKYLSPILFDCFLFILLLESKLFDEIHTYVCRQIKSYSHNIPHALSWVIFCPISYHFPRHFHISGAGEGAASSSAVGLQSLAKRQFWGLRREVGWTPNDLMVFRWDLYGIYLHDLTCIIFNNIYIHIIIIYIIIYISW